MRKMPTIAVKGMALRQLCSAIKMVWKQELLKGTVLDLKLALSNMLPLRQFKSIWSVGSNRLPIDFQGAWRPLFESVGPFPIATMRMWTMLHCLKKSEACTKPVGCLCSIRAEDFQVQLLLSKIGDLVATMTPWIKC